MRRMCRAADVTPQVSAAPTAPCRRPVLAPWATAWPGAGLASDFDAQKFFACFGQLGRLLVGSHSHAVASRRGQDPATTFNRGSLKGKPSMRTCIKRGGTAALLAAAGIAVSISSAGAASASPGVYACYQTGTLVTVGSDSVNYIVPKAVTTDSTYCPPGTTAVGI